MTGNGTAGWGSTERQYLADSRVLMVLLDAIMREREPSQSAHVYDWRLERHRVNYKHLPRSLLRAWGQQL